MNKRGNILIENLIFIILNLLFLSILILFVLRQGNGEIVLEEAYAKQIALLIDAAKPGMVFRVNLDKGVKVAEKNGVLNKMIEIHDNIVTIKLSERGGYSYSFFNDVAVNFYKDKIKGVYVFVINNK